jgi:hypothetical protein
MREDAFMLPKAGEVRVIRAERCACLAFGLVFSLTDSVGFVVAFELFHLILPYESSLV